MSENVLFFKLYFWIFAAIYGGFVLIQSIRLPILMAEYPLLTLVSVALLPLGVIQARRVLIQFDENHDRMNRDTTT